MWPDAQHFHSSCFGLACSSLHQLLGTSRSPTAKEHSHTHLEELLLDPSFQEVFDELRVLRTVMGFLSPILQQL